MNNLTVAHSPTSIFFEGPQTEEEKKQGILNAKLTLIADIIKIKSAVGFVPDGEYFDQLMDLDIDLLHAEIIKAEDWAHTMQNKRKISNY